MVRLLKREGWGKVNVKIKGEPSESLLVIGKGRVV